jgi:hypothetical protein
LNKSTGLLKHISSNNSEIDLNAFINILYHLIVITNEDIQGQNLFAGELMALLVWNIYTDRNLAYFGFNNPLFSPLFEGLTETYLDYKNNNFCEISTELQYFQKKDCYNLLNFDENAFSFELYKELFLERNIFESKLIKF